MKAKTKPDLDKLMALARYLELSFSDSCAWDGDADWEHHAYHEERFNGTEGCWHCMARDALGEGRP